MPNTGKVTLSQGCHVEVSSQDGIFTFWDYKGEPLVVGDAVEFTGRGVDFNILKIEKKPLKHTPKRVK